MQEPRRCTRRRSRPRRVATSSAGRRSARRRVSLTGSRDTPWTSFNSRISRVRRRQGTLLPSTSPRRSPLTVPAHRHPTAGLRRQCSGEWAVARAGGPGRHRERRPCGEGLHRGAEPHKDTNHRLATRAHRRHTACALGCRSLPITPRSAPRELGPNEQRISYNNVTRDGSGGCKVTRRESCHRMHPLASGGRRVGCAPTRWPWHMMTACSAYLLSEYIGG